MNKKISDNYIAILRSELMPALGCTEPIAVAYAAAKAVDILGIQPEHVDMLCSGNIIKNVKGVSVPNSGGLKGIDIAAVLGIVGGNPEKELEVLESVTKEHIEKAKELQKKGFCTCNLAEGVENLYIEAKVRAGEHTASVLIKDKHTNIIRLEKDGQVIFDKNENNCDQANDTNDKSLLNVRDIVEFAKTVKLTELKDILDREIEMNTAISNEGLKNNYGADVGKTLLKTYEGNDVKIRSRAAAAAASDARMGGCALPVVINSGSGNQGITVSMPVIEYAKHLAVSQDMLYRALIISNLVAIHQKKHIGSLSAYCGAVSAACGSGAAITYMAGGDYEAISRTITNTIANVGGIICDGAKSSCAAKIATSVDAAIMAYHMSMENKTFGAGEGVVKEDVEKTIASVGRIGRDGMKSTDIEILNIMLDN